MHAILSLKPSLKPSCNVLQVWAVDLLLFYTHTGKGTIGESWASPASYVQLAGFVLLLLGSIVYAQVNPYTSMQCQLENSGLFLLLQLTNLRLFERF